MLQILFIECGKLTQADGGNVALGDLNGAAYIMFFFFNFLVCIYLSGSAKSLLRHMGSF